MHGGSNNQNKFEFELDLAPLLAVMVKLVPVLLISSAFVQMQTIETELPQAVQNAIQEPENKISISMKVLSNRDIEINIQDNQKNKTVKVEAITEYNMKTVDLKNLHLKLIEIKKDYPNIFAVDLSPSPNIQYNEIVKIMDEARRSRDANVNFEFMDKKQNKLTTTPYMFPEIVFGNVLEG